MQYQTYTKQKFSERRLAEEWAKEQKQKYKDGELGVIKFNIEFDKGVWVATLLVPVE